MVKQIVSSFVVVLALTFSTSAFAAVSGANPTPQVSTGSDSTSGINWWTVAQIALGL